MTFVHELGHFMVAKYNNATVVEFAIGFGPVIYQKKVGDTAYSLRALPFGGYVSVLSDEIVQGLEKLKTMELTPQQAVSLKKQLKGFDQSVNWLEKPTIDKVSSPRKVWFACMGVTMNFFMLWAVLFVTYASAGKKMDDNSMYITPYVATTYVGGSIKAKPIHTIDGKKSGDPEIALQNQTEETDKKSGNEYYEEIQKTTSALKLEDGPIDLIEKDLGLSYIETETVYDFEGDLVPAWDTKEGPKTFDFDKMALLPMKTFAGKPIEVFWIYSATDYEKYPEVQQTSSFVPVETASNFSLRPPKPDKEEAAVGSTIAFPVAYKDGTTIVPYNTSMFGVIEDYQRPGFGKSIYISLEDSFIYLWKGVIVLFDLITFGLVLDPTTPYMYANNQHIVTATAGLWWGNITFVMFVWMSYLMIVFNILPFPPLDGWHAFEYAYEGIKKKPISQKTTSLVFKIGIALFFIVLIGGMFIGV